MERRGFLAGILGLPLAPAAVPVVVAAIKPLITMNPVDAGIPTTAALAHLASVLYKKRALDRLQRVFAFKHFNESATILGRRAGETLNQLVLEDLR